MAHHFNSYARHINCVQSTNLNTTKNKDFLSKFLTFLKLFHLIIDNFTILFIYSGIAIYRFDIDRFSACTFRNFWSPIKFHINNVIYFRIHRSPNYRFSALIICKSRSRRGIFCMDRLKKKIEAKYLLMALPSLWTIHLATQ